MPPAIYFDTNVLRYFATSFREVAVAPALKRHFVMSPISLLELLSELATADAEAAFRTIQAFPNIFDTDHVTLLPWEDDVFRTLVFGLPQAPNQLVDLLGNATRRAFHANCPADLEADARQLRDLMDHAKRETTDDFARLLDSWRAHNGVPDHEHRLLFANAIARRANVPPEGINVERVIDTLSALWAYEYERLTNAAEEPNYNPHVHENDVYDAQQLIYLSHPDMHFLTCDRGFRKAAASPQYPRIHCEPVHIFQNPMQAAHVIQNIVNPPAP